MTRESRVASALASALAASLCGCWLPHEEPGLAQAPGSGTIFPAAQEQAASARPGERPGGQAPDLSPASTGPGGAVRLVVAWPRREAMFLPVSAESIEIVAYKGDRAEPLATGRATRSPGQSQSTVTLDRLPPGELAIGVTARDIMGEVVAAGDATASITPNRLARVAISLEPSELPEILSFSPASTVPGEPIAVTGRGFWLDAPERYAFTIAGAAVPWYRAYLQGRSKFVLTVPAGAGSGSVDVKVGPYTARSVTPFVAVASISLQPLEVTLGPGEKVQFTAKAYDAAGREIPGAVIPWNMDNQECIGNGCEDFDAAKVRNGLAVAELDVGNFVILQDGSRVRADAPGALQARGEIVAGNLLVRATGSITVRMPG